MRSPTKARTLARGAGGRRRLPRPLGQGRGDRRTWSRRMAPKPIIFAMANPDPEITPEEVRAVRATRSSPPAGRTIRTRSTTCWASPTSSAARSTCAPPRINDEMKIAAAEALAALAREDVPDEVDAAYAGRRLRYGPEYIIPAPFDPRLIAAVPAAVAKAAMDSGVARKPIVDMEAYRPSCRRGSTRPRSACSASSSACATIPSASSSPRARRRR